MLRRSFLKSTALATIATLALAAGAHAENPVLKIGFVGVTSGPAAAWGISNQRSPDATWAIRPGGNKASRSLGTNG